MFDLNTPETSMSVAFNSFVTPTTSPPSTTLPVPAGVMFTLPFVFVAESVLPSALKLSTFSCPVVVCTPVAVIGPVSTIAPVPAGSTTKSPFESVVIVPSARMFKSPTPIAPTKVVAPVIETFPVIVCPIVVIAPATSKAPEMFTASFNCISVLSAELIAVPFKVNAPTTTFPVPLAWIEMSALEPFD